LVIRHGGESSEDFCGRNHPEHSYCRLGPRPGQ
jgi:hypothetical protein